MSADTQSKSSAECLPRGAFRVFDHVETRPGGREEFFSDLTDDFGYLAVLSEHDRYCDRVVPWHWHQEIEFFYVESGSIDVGTVHEQASLQAGAAGFVNANVLHTTRATGGMAGASLLVHEVRPRFLAEPGGRLWRSYVEPLANCTGVEMAYVLPSGGRDAELCRRMRASFETVAAGKDGWELRLRDQISEIWLAFFERLRPRLGETRSSLALARSERLKTMLDYIGAHYPEQLSVRDIAESAFSSERECHRIFKESLGVTPAQYLREYRIQQACRLLAYTSRPTGAVAAAAGLGSASHFGQVFREAMGCTPTEYRRTWQDKDSPRQD